MESYLKSFLEKHNIHYKAYTHPAVFTVAESDKVTQHIPGTRSKNLFLKSEGQFYLVSLPGHRRLDMKALKRYLNLTDLHFASPEELKQDLHLTPGSVSIFGMIHAKNTRLLIDKEIWQAEQVGFHPNINTATIVLSHENLERFCNALLRPWEVIDFA